ncbi:MAG TPA: hypothetical protein VGC88_07875 [Terriglobales bacterium]
MARADSGLSSAPELTSELGSKMWVFRDGKRRVRTRELLDTLNVAISSSAPALEVLLRAGEAEAALADAGCNAAPVARVTDAAADALVHGTELKLDPVQFVDECPEELRIGTPEGFAFYLLHPLAFRELARSVHPAGTLAAVIGIRSIGATLSAVVAKTLDAERITVRPVGHPYERTVELTPEQRAWIQHHLQRGAHFYVVDEGPGFSGSSLISTAEALEEAGVPNDRVAILCTAQPDPNRLMATDGALRWQHLHSYKTMPYLPEAVRDEKWYWAEHWRTRIYGKDETHWPGVWRQVETPKFLARDDHRLFRFIGFAHYGAPVLQRYQRLAEAQLGPNAKGDVEGFAEFWMDGGAAFTVPKWNEKTHGFMVRYLAERIRLCPAEAQAAEDNLSELERMVHFNTCELLGRAHDVRLRLDYPVYADNRMQPYKFLRTPYGMRKLDGAPHGDDHFFPGPCDIAWDVAGAIYEWQLTEGATEQLLRDYSAMSGDMFIRSRLRDWTIAYLAFRCGYYLMGASANVGWPEGERLMRDARRYHMQLQKVVGMERRKVSQRIPA